jgi:hypothetical protein
MYVDEQITRVDMLTVVYLDGSRIGFGIHYILQRRRIRRNSRQVDVTPRL